MNQLRGESEEMSGQRMPCHRDEYGRYDTEWGEEEGRRDISLTVMSDWHDLDGQVHSV